MRMRAGMLHQRGTCCALCHNACTVHTRSGAKTMGQKHVVCGGRIRATHTPWHTQQRARTLVYTVVRAYCAQCISRRRLASWGMGLRDPKACHMHSHVDTPWMEPLTSSAERVVESWKALREVQNGSHTLSAATWWNHSALPSALPSCSTSSSASACRSPPDTTQ